MKMGCATSQPVTANGRSTGSKAVLRNEKAEKMTNDMSNPYNYDGSTLNVFISYSSKCRNDEIRELAKHLVRKKKLNAWIDVEEMHGSTAGRMSEGIKACDIVIVFYSEAYQKSENCRLEVEQAGEHRKTVLYVRMQRGFEIAPWLADNLGDNLWVDFKDGSDIAEIADQIVIQLYQLFDPSLKNDFKDFKLIGIESELFAEKIYQKLDYQPKLNAMKNICRTATGQGGLLVVSGDEGVGKTYFVSLLLLRPENRTFLSKECNARAALWFNCYSWRDQKKFQNNEEVKTAFSTELLNTFSRATRRKLASTFEEHVRILNVNFQAPPIIIFDDVFHLPLLSYIRSQCKTLPCVAITRTKFFNEMQSETPWNQLAPEVETILPISHENMVEMLQEMFDLRHLDGAQLRKLAESCKGLPGQALQMVTKEGPAKQNPITEEAVPIVHSSDGDAAELKFIGVPDFENYFVRPQDENDLRNGIKQLASKKQNEKGCFVIEGCGGIGKSTLIAHVLRDPKNKPFFQETCKLNIFIWLNCYGWREGLGAKKEQNDAFFAKLLELGQTAAPKATDNFKTLNHMLEHFSDENQRILYVLDDVFHYSILDSLRIECPSVLCCAVTRDSSSLTGPGFDPFLKLRDQNVANPCQIGYLDHDRVIEILKTDFKLKDKLRGEQFFELGKRCGGMPLIVSLTGGQFRNCRDGQYQRAYKKLLGEGKLGSLNVGKTGRGEEKASQLFDSAWQSLTLEDRKRYYAFILFNPVQSVTDKSLKLIWNCQDIEDVRDVCIAWERLSLVRRFTESWSSRSEDSYLIHQILHELAVEKAAKDFEMEQGQSTTSKSFLSKLRIRLLIETSSEFDNNAIGNLFTTFRRLRTPDLLRAIFGLIDDNASKFVLPPVSETSPLLCGLNPKDFESTLVIAVEMGHYNLAKYLISCGCSVNSKDSESITPLMRAASGDLKIVEFLVSKGAEIEATDKQGLTPLMWASLGGNEKIVEFVISKGAKIEAVALNGETSLMKAASEGHERVVNLLISKGANIEARGYNGATAFMKAAQQRHEKIVELLIGNGAKIDATDNYGKTAFLSAAGQGLHRTVDLLISKGAKVDEVDKQGQTALMMAALGRHDKAVELLLSRGAKINATDKTGKTPLMIVAKRNDQKMFELLISKGADVNVADDEGTTALMRAVYAGNDKFVEILISNGANIDAADNYGQTALWLAASYNHIETVKLLASNGANIDVINAGGDSPLSIAATFGFDKVVDYLLSRGPKLEIGGKNGKKLFFSAAHGGNLKLVEMLISQGADVNEPNDYCRTVLMEAMIGKHHELADLLISKGADINAVDQQGQSVLILAARGPCVEGAAKLLSLGVNPDVTDKTGETPLMHAANSYSCELIERLLSKGANIDAADNLGKTALMKAASQGFGKIVTLLISKGANVDAIDKDGNTALMQAVERSRTTVIQLLVANGGANVDLANIGGLTPLILAIQTCHTIETIQLLVSNGAQLDAKDQRGETALTKAALCGKEEFIEYLIEKGAKIDDPGKMLITAAAGGLGQLVEQLLSIGADVNSRDADGATALMRAAERKEMKTIEMLAKNGARVDLADKDGNTALIFAACHGLVQAVELFIEKGADVNACNNDGETALLKSLAQKISKVVEMLLENGANVYAKNNKGATALILASGMGLEQVVAILISKGADIEAADNDGKTALLRAATWGHEEVVKLLLAKGANVNARDNEGKTALVLAENSNENVAKLLR